MTEVILPLDVAERFKKTGEVEKAARDMGRARGGGKPIESSHVPAISPEAIRGPVNEHKEERRGVILNRSLERMTEALVSLKLDHYNTFAYNLKSQNFIRITTHLYEHCLGEIAVAREYNDPDRVIYYIQAIKLLFERKEGELATEAHDETFSANPYIFGFRRNGRS